MSALSKALLAEKLTTKIPFNYKQAKHVVDCFFEEISRALVSGYHVKLSGFGNFSLRDKGERPGRNPKTGEVVAIEPRRVVTFRAGQKLRTRVEAVSELPQEDS